MTDISYSNLAISNGSLAADKLAKLAKGIIPEQELGSTKANLLQYCKQDTWAMVRIWEEVKKKLKVN